MEQAACNPAQSPPRRPVGRGFGPDWGVLVVGHGTADTVGAAETRLVTERIASVLPGVPVELGFLEVIPPTIGDALTRLAAAGCRHVVAAPLLLFEAGHAKKDVPEAIAAVAAALGLVVHRAGPLGCHPAIVRLSRQRRASLVAADLPAESTALVMVGRGSSDPSTPAQLGEFAAATLVDDPRPGRLLLGFVAAARPSLPEALAAAGDPSPTPVRRVVVQPHLLFRGHVEEQVGDAVAVARAARPELEWLQVPRLGPDPLVAEAVVDRAIEAVRVAGASG